MTLIEASLLVMALASVITCVTVLLVARRMLPVLRRSGRLLRKSNRTLNRVNRAAHEMERIAHDARRLEGRVSRSAHGILDQVEPMLHAVRALVAGTRTGLGSLFGSNGDAPARDRTRLSHERSRT